MFLAFYNPPFFRISSRYFLPWFRESLQVKGLAKIKRKRARERHANGIKSNFDLISFYLFMLCVTRFLSSAWVLLFLYTVEIVTGYWLDYRHDLGIMFNTLRCEHYKLVLMISSEKKIHRRAKSF